MAGRTWRWCSRPRTAPSLDTMRVPGFFTYDGFYARAARPHADDRRQTAEGELGARPLRRRERGQAAICQPVSRHPRALRQGFHRRLDRRDQQSAAEAAAQRQAEIPEAERSLRADVADPADLRVDPRRNRADARAAQAAGAANAAAGKAKQAALSAGRPSVGRDGP